MKLSPDSRGRARWLDRDGYVRVYVGTKHPLGRKSNGTAREHHLAWFEAYGEVVRWPYTLDHVDENKRHNGVGNLRKCHNSSHAHEHAKHVAARRRKPALVIEREKITVYEGERCNRN